MEIVVVLFCMD